MVEFLRWALAQPATWALTYSQYVAWLEAGPAVDVSTGWQARPQPRFSRAVLCLQRGRHAGKQA